MEQDDNIVKIKNKELIFINGAPQDLVCLELDTKNKTERCINCGLCIFKIQKVLTLALPHACKLVLSHWIEFEISEESKLCKKCYEIIIEYDLTQKSMPERVLGHKPVCFGCGKSVLRSRQMKISDEILQYLYTFWPWHTMYEDKICCYPCTLRIQRKLQIAAKCSNDSIMSLTQVQQEAIEPIISDETQMNILTQKIIRPIRLTTYLKKFCEQNVAPKITSDMCITLTAGRRTPTSHRCWQMPECGTRKKSVSKCKKWLSATYYDIFTPDGVRTCKYHSFLDLLKKKTKMKMYNNFNISNFETFVDEIKSGLDIIDFENVEAMPDHICQYWTGLSVLEFMEMYEKLNKPKIMKSALAIYLIRKITGEAGDSVQKLAKLLNISYSTVLRHLRVVDIHFRAHVL